MAKWTKEYPIDFSPFGDKQGQAIVKIINEIEIIYERLNLVLSNWINETSEPGDTERGQTWINSNNEFLFKDKDNFLYLTALCENIQDSDFGAAQVNEIEGTNKRYSLIYKYSGDKSPYKTGTDINDLVVARSDFHRINPEQTALYRIGKNLGSSGSYYSLNIGDKVLYEAENTNLLQVFIQSVAGGGGVWRIFLVAEPTSVTSTYLNASIDGGTHSGEVATINRQLSNSSQNLSYSLNDRVHVLTPNKDFNVLIAEITIVTRTAEETMVFINSGCISTGIKFSSLGGGRWIQNQLNSYITEVYVGITSNIKLIIERLA